MFTTTKKDYFTTIIEAWLILAKQDIKEEKYLMKVVVVLNSTYKIEQNF